MGKTRKILGFFVFLVSVVFGANAFAAGYVCNDIKKYTSCNSGYYLSDCGTTYDGRTLSEGDLTVGNSCAECPGDTYDCSGGMMCPKSKTVTITLEKNGGTGDVSATFDCLMDKPCELPSAGLSKDGYQFSGWSSNNDATSGETTMTFSSDSVVYAAWAPNTYTVTFKIGATELGTQSFTYGKSQSLTKLSELSNVPAELSGHGWSFDGWSSSTTVTGVSLSDGGVTSNLTTDANGNVILYGVWSRPVTFTYYDGASATNVTTKTQIQYYYTDGTVTPNRGKATYVSVSQYNLKTQEQYGWEPIGWALANTGTSQLHINLTNTSSGTPGIGAEAKYYAVYKRPVTLKYNGNGNTGGTTGNTSTDQFFNAGGSSALATYMTLANNGFEKTGYTFDKWIAGSLTGTQHAPGEYWSFPNVAWQSSASYDMYAKWNPNTYTVSFDTNGGSGGQLVSVTATYDSEMPGISTTAPTRTGYTFMGWYDSADVQYYTAAGASARTYDKTENATLYAGWSANCNKITLTAPGAANHFDAPSLSTLYVKTRGTTLYIDPNCSTEYTSSHYLSVIPSITTDGQTARFDQFLGWTDKTTVNGIVADTTLSGYLLNGDGEPTTYLSSNPITSDTRFYATFARACDKGDAGTCVRNISYNDSTMTLDYVISCNEGYRYEKDSASFASSCPAKCNAITLNANGGTGGSVTKLYMLTGLSLVFTDDECSAGYEYASSNYTSIIPSRSGYTFRGFYSADLDDAKSDTRDGTQYFQKTGERSELFTVKADTTIYAAWAQNCATSSVANCSLSVSNLGVVDYTTSCVGGYTINDNDKDTCTPTCSANTFTIIYDGGVDATGSMDDQTCTYGENCIVAPNGFSKEDHNFVEWLCSGSDVSCDGDKINPGDNLKDATETDSAVITLTAQWSLGVSTCTAGQTYDGKLCPEGSYCPGEKVPVGAEYGANGCERACPPDLSGGTVSSPEGATDISQCKTTRNNVALDDKTGVGDQYCNYNPTKKDYSNSCTIKITGCAGGRYREQENSVTCAPVDSGEYSPDNDIYSYRCSDLPGADDTVTSPAGSDAAEDCYNTCLAIPIANGSKNPVRGEVSYDGEEKKIPACEYTTKCDPDPGYSVNGDACEPDVFKITLDHDGGVSSVNTIYLKYNTGWYSDADAKDPITLIDLPTKDAETCRGYYYDNQRIVGDDGKLTDNYTVFDKDAEIVASWVDKPTASCPAGTYYTGSGEECAKCIEGNYCPGVKDVVQGSGQVGMSTCASLNGLYDPATDELGEKMTVEINSDAGAKSASECFATNVEYISDTLSASGSQTCYYNQTSGAYDGSCDARDVLRCVAGYYYDAKENGIDCIVVGTGYYSPENSTAQIPCPNLDDDIGVTTFSEKSAEVKQCYLEGVWYEPENGHSGHRRSCYHHSDASDTNVETGYTWNCQVSTIVTCDAGYYDDGTHINAYGERDCKEVPVDHWSPGQSDCDGEDEKPLVAGCSTKEKACEPGSTTNGKTGATSAEACVYTTCEPNYVCAPGEKPQLCSVLTEGEFPLSEANTTSVDGCYKTCETPCVEGECLPNMTCIYQKGNNSGRWYNGKTACEVKNNACEIDYDSNQTYCDASYYLNTNNKQCSLCSELGDYNRSRSATLAKGEYACFADCAPSCDYTKVNILDADENIVGTKNVCPENATCTEGALPSIGYKWYPQTYCTPTDYCKFTYVCNPGFVADTEGDIEYGQKKLLNGKAYTSEVFATCTPGTYEVTLNDNGGSGGDGTVYQKYTVGWSLTNFDDLVDSVSVPTRDGYTFTGYYDAETDGNLVIGTNGMLPAPDTFTDNTTLYAHWSQNMVACQAGLYYENGVEKTCPEGKYCPGTGEIGEGSTGCIEECPDGGATTVKDGGASKIEQCRKVVSGSEADREFGNGTARWDCAYSTLTRKYTGGCIVLPLTCYAGYYYDSQGLNNECKFAENGYYSPGSAVADSEKDEASMERNPCPGKLNDDGTTLDGIGSGGLRASITDCTSACATTAADIPHSDTVTPDTPTVNSDENGVYPACSYTITCNKGYDKYDGTEPKCTAMEYTIILDKNDGVGDVDEFIKCTFDSGECALPSTDKLTRDGYVTANQWCEKPDGSGECYTAGENTVKNISDKGDNTTLYAIWNPGVFKVELEDANQDPIYLKYTVGWYSDSGAENKLTSIGGELPVKSGYDFAGYKLGNVKIVDDKGMLQETEDALKSTTTHAVAHVIWAEGKTACEPGYYYLGTGGAENCKECEENHWCPGGTFGTGEGIDGLNKCPEGGLSKGGVEATNAGVCYKEGLPYTSSTERATGTQTCYYDDTDGKKVYDARCKEKVVNTCIGGYYRANDKDVDCTEVGKNYYSPDESIKRIACPDGGITGEKITAEKAGECYKTVPYTATNGSGTMVCNYTKQNDDGSALYNTDPRDWFIDKCNPGYYRVAETATDCEEIEKNFYGPVNKVYKEPCPEDNVSGTGGITNSKGSTSAAACYVEDQPFESEHGDGVQRCDYNEADRVYDGCDKRTFHNCHPGYYWDRSNKDDCVPVDYGHFGPVADESNPGHATARQLCPTFDGRAGQTETNTSADASACFMTEVPCGNASTGTGTRTCNYDVNAQSYSDTCTTTCEIDGCPSGHYLDSASNTCIECPPGMICGPETGIEGGEDPKACKDLFDGRYPNSDAGSTDTGQCYGTCDVTTNASTMTGRDYQNDALDTCEVKTCKPGYDLENGKCVKCDEGKYCPGDADGDGENDGESDACPASHPNSDAGNADIGKCYTSCAKSAYASTMTGRDYYAAKDTCAINTCLPGYKLSGGICDKCGDGEICPGDADGDGENDGEATSCPTSYPNSDAGNTDLGKCYTACAKSPNASTMTGRDYYTAEDTCAINTCLPGYKLAGGKCTKCGDGEVCPGDADGDGENDGDETSCPTSHPNSDAGNADIGKCYTSCAESANASTMTGRDYYTAKDTCAINTCLPGYKLSGGKCTKCGDGEVCPGDADGDGENDGDVTSCPTSHPHSDNGTSDINMCYTDCAKLANVDTMIGRNYYGRNVADTCEIQKCKSGYYMTDGKVSCELCPEGTICDPNSGSDMDGDGVPDGKPKTCAELTKGTHVYAAAGSSSIKDCYMTCESYDIVYGVAIPDNEIEYYNNVCKFRGMSVTDNPCVIEKVNGVETCVEKSCNPDYELIDGYCRKCERENATAYKTNGNCLVAKCHVGFHPDGDQCVADVAQCNIPNADIATKVWNSKLGAYDICRVETCVEGYHVASNACVPDIEACNIANGTGTREWNLRKGTWGDCIVTACKPGFEPDTQSKQCVACPNTFGALGEVAVSSWTKGCTIASCMYQGELYDLRNNECVQICPMTTYTDETGSLKWNDKTKRCERNCEDGFVQW